MSPMNSRFSRMSSNQVIGYRDGVPIRPSDYKDRRIRSYKAMSAWDIISFVEELIDKDFSQRQIAKALGCHESSVRAIIKRAARSAKLPVPVIKAQFMRSPLRRISPKGVIIPAPLLHVCGWPLRTLLRFRTETIDGHKVIVVEPVNEAEVQALTGADSSPDGSQVEASTAAPE